MFNLNSEYQVFGVDISAKLRNTNDDDDDDVDTEKLDNK